MPVRRRFVAEDVVTGKIGFGVGRPYQIDEWRLAYTRENRLQSGGHGGGEDIVGEDLGHRSVVAFDFNLGLAGFGNNVTSVAR